MATIKLSKQGRSLQLNLQGLVLTKRQPLEDLPASFCFKYLGDANLEISFVESDREELRQVEPSGFKRLSKSLNSNITTHDELCALLLPPKPKAKKPLLKSKKSSLTE